MSNLKKVILTGLIVIFSVFNIGNEVKAEQFSASSIQATPIYPKYFFEGKYVKSSDEEGLYKYGGNYLPSAINYKNAVYVPIEFITKNIDYSLIYDSGDIYLGILDNYDPGVSEEIFVSGEPGDLEEENSNITIKDLKFLNIKPYEDSSNALDKLNFKNMNVQEDGNQIFITDSVYTDTSFFMTLETNDDLINGMYYEDFGVKLKNIKDTKSYLKKQPSIKTSRGLIVPGSKMSEVMKLYGNNPDIEISYAPTSDRNGFNLKKELVKSFNPYLDDSTIKVEMKPYWLPSKEDTLRYINITYTFDNDDAYGDLTFFASVKKDDKLQNATVYGFEYNLNN